MNARSQSPVPRFDVEAVEGRGLDFHAGRDAWDGYHLGMATAPNIPSLDGLLDSILDQLPGDVVASIAAMRPKAARKRDTFAAQVVRMIHARARARTAESEANPLPDVPEFNELTRRTIRDARAGKDVTRYANLDEAFADLGL